MENYKVGILLFNEVEVLDFAGPFEVFAVTTLNWGQEDAYHPFQVSTISENGALVTAKNGLKVTPDYSFADAPVFDVLVIPGGMGTRHEIHNKVLLAWIKQQSEQVKWMTSVCTGAFLLAEIGLLNGKRATTHWASIERMRTQFPQTTIVENVKYVDEGNVITSAGISAGIEMSLHMVGRILGPQAARNTARSMEYDGRYEL
ncbi:AraC family transcriptional regulator [Paenibacillus sp. BIHB 4019]|uniref:AraC family transcriptional regulator n=1 Tax=Paenibacillus sp. BIHB 4019 TaxID=1870819 RepID=A0A1B2DDA5_9BACL|nr:DJ-1/PfpI family protein [Paenibacillus sp. BIHB 4019]ANY65694.1 AraC family transcriptional regulator [Paenibacillus sp. BIHB 4019]